MSLQARRARRMLCRWLLRATRRVAPIVVVPVPLQRALLALARRLGKPVGESARSGDGPQLAPVAFVFDAAAACRVLRDRETFDVTLYEQKMRAVLGPFFLGLDYATPEYHEQIALWNQIATSERAERVENLAWHAAYDTPLSLAHAGTVDVVEWSARVLDAFVDAYFFDGVATMTRPTDEGTRLALFRRTASYIFNLDVLNSHLRDDATEAGRELKGRLVDIIQNRRSSRPPGDAPNTAVLDHLLTRTNDDDLLSTVLAGTLSGLYVPTSSLFVDAVDLLLDLPSHELEMLQAAARSRILDSESLASLHNQALVGRHVLEAGRFKPFPAGLLRRCAQETTLSTATGKSRVLASGTVVVAMMSAVALDPRLAERPGTFAISRPREQYMLFGCGQHECIGATTKWPIATALTTAMATRLFALRGLRRATGPKGTIQSQDGWPASFELRYDEDPLPKTRVPSDTAVPAAAAEGAT